MNNIFVTLRNLSLGIAIAILLPFTAYWGLQVLDPNPSRVRGMIVTRQPRRAELSSEIHESQRRIEKLISSGAAKAELAEQEAKLASLKEEKKELDKTYEEQEKKYDLLRKRHENYAFVIYTIVGIASLVAGAYMKITFLGLGFILGGIASLTTGYVFFWNRLHDILKFISLLIALVIIIATGYRWTYRKEDE